MNVVGLLSFVLLSCLRCLFVCMTISSGIRHTGRSGYDFCLGHRSKFNEEDEVLTNTSYDRLTQICCSGQVYENPTIQEQVAGHRDSRLTYNDCCGKTPVMWTPGDVCCGSTFHVSHANESLHCCGEIAYNNTRPCPKYCNRKMYNPHSHFCCGGELLKQGIGYDCCANKSYSVNEKTCYNGVLLDINHIACNQHPSGSVNSATHMCCNGKPHLKTDDSVCCGTEAMDKKKHQCCRYYRRGHAIYEPFNPRTDTCCSDGLMKKSAGHCCKRRWKMTENQVCCRWSGPKTPISGEDGCCQRRNSPYKFYNKNQHVCQNGYLKPIHSTKELCGREWINPAKDLCCNGRAFEGERRRLLCCGNGVNGYDPDNEECLPGGTVRSVLSKCGGDIINTQKFTCCRYRKFSFPLLVKDVPTRGGCSEFLRTTKIDSVCDSQYVAVVRTKRSKPKVQWIKPGKRMTKKLRKETCKRYNCTEMRLFVVTVNTNESEIPEYNFHEIDQKIHRFKKLSKFLRRYCNI